ncbi:MAG: ABC transporter substrate-binding protein [Phycisphaerae bacterium]
MKRFSLGWFLALALAGAGCDRPATRPGADSPRIVSHSPALTRILIDLGLSKHIVGVTRYCPSVPDANVPAVGDLTRVNTEAILATDPDVVLIQQKREDFDLLSKVRPEIRVEHFQIDRLEDIPVAALRIGKIVGKPDIARRAAHAFHGKLQFVRMTVIGRDRPSVLFVMGTTRPSVHAEGTFVDDLITTAGGVNAAKSIPGARKWRKATLETIASAGPDVLIVQSSPGKVDAARAYWSQWKQIPAVAAGRVHVVTDEAWMTPTLQLADLAADLADMIHPDRPTGEAL